MNHYLRSFAFYACMLLSFFSSQAQYAPIRPIRWTDPAVSTATQGIAEELPHTYAEDTDGTIYVAGAYNYDNFLGRYNPSLGTFSWLIKLEGNTGYEGIKHVFLGPDNTVNVVSANIYGTADLDPGAGTVQISNTHDLIWIKYGKDGAFISARKLTETTGDPYSPLFDVANDAAGNIYVYASCYSDNHRLGSKDLDPGAGTLIASGVDYLAKYNASGSLVWAKTFASNIAWRIRDLKATGDAVYLAGHFWSTVDFDLDHGVQTLTPASTSTRDAFLARYSASTGAYNWAFNVGGQAGDGIERIHLQGDAVSVCGVFNYTGDGGVDFDPSAQGTYLLKGSSGGGQLFVATYGFNKEFRSAFRLTENASRYYYDDSFNVKSFTTDAQGNYFVGGNLSHSSANTWDVDPSEKEFLLRLTTGSTSTGFILKYSGNGTLTWGSGYYQTGGWYNQLGHFFPSRAPGIPFVLIGMYQGSTYLDPVNRTVRLNSNRYDASYQRYYQEMFIAPYCELTAMPAPASAWPRYIKTGTSATFRINPIAGAATYNWSIPPGFSIKGKDNNTEITIIATDSMASGDIVVRAINDCGVSGAYKSLVVSGVKDAATITQENIVKVYGDVSFTLQATSNSTAAVSYEVISNATNAISLTGNTVAINGVGEAVLAARVIGDANYGDGVKTFTVKIDKRPLTVKAGNYVRIVGEANPPLTLTYDGFVAGEDASDLVVAPVAFTTATPSSPVGVYPVIVWGGYDDHYSLLPEDGTLTVVSKLPATVSLSNLRHVYNGSVVTPTVATQPTGLAVKLLYNGSSLPPKNAGTYVVDATIESDRYEGRTIDTLVIEKAQQAITLGAMPELVLGDGTVNMPAEASSGLPVVLSATPYQLVSIEGFALTPVSTGQVQLTFSQAGDNNFHAAQTKQVSLCIKPRKPVIEIMSGRPEYAELKSSSKVNNQWYENDMPIPGATSQSYFVTLSGSYKVSVTSNGCTNVSDPVGIWIPTGDDSFSVSSYPNPVVETVKINVSSPAPDAAIAIFNDKGLKVLEVLDVREENELQVSNLAPGIYHLVFWDGREKKVQRLLKK